jgi:hypothetical protein
MPFFNANFLEEKWHNRAPASVKYTITPEDGRVRPKHVDEQLKKSECYIDGQKEQILN